MNTTGIKILNIRKSKKLSQTVFAESTGVSRSYVAQIEKGDKYPSEKYLRTIINVFDLNDDYFEDDVNEHQFYNILDSKIISVYDFKTEESKLFRDINMYYQRIVDVFLMCKQLNFSILKKEVNNSLDLLAKARSKYINERLSSNRDEISSEDQIHYLNEMMQTKNEFKNIYFLYHKEFYNNLMIS